MADQRMLMSQAEIFALKETLYTQQELLQKLHNELVAKREASATAASEALPVILRVQGEMAAVKIEAEQYKRLAEERMCHAEESFAIIEDMIQQRELEMAALDYQVETYRHKLLSMGRDDLFGDGVEKNETLMQDTGLHGLHRRNSAPVLVNCKKTMIDTQSTCPNADMMPKIMEGLRGHTANVVLEPSWMALSR